MKVSDNTSISMPMRNLISIVIAVGMGVWAYFGIVEQLNKIETELQLMQQDLSAASEIYRWRTKRRYGITTNTRTVYVG